MLYIPNIKTPRARPRTFILILAALLTLLVLIQAAAAHAKAPMVGTQGPGFYRIMVGKYEVTALLDGTHPFPIDSVMTHVPRAEIERDLALDDLNRPSKAQLTRI